VQAFWHRNNNWRRPLPPNAGPDLEHLLNWRLYKQWSGGLLAELGSHQISFVNTIFGSLPESAMAIGGVDYWKDGREIDDNVHAVLRYPGGQTLEGSFITTNRLDGAQERIYGTGGSIMLTHSEATFYKEPWYPNSAVPPEMTIEHKLITGPTYSAEQPYHGKGETSHKGDPSSADLLALEAFVDCIRHNRKPAADVDAGWSEGVTVALANRALEERRNITMAEFLASAAG
jgi:predicted dehydrogenase